MQDAYVGDIGDFGKFSLLRHLTSSTSLKVGVLWHYVIPARINSDGKHRKYLEDHDPHVVEHVDRELYRTFRSANFSDASGHTVGELENLLPEFRYYHDVFHAKTGEPFDRSDWFSKAMRKFQDCDVIFFDPDNGITTSQSTSEKRVHLRELRSMFDQGHTVLVYHHLGRKVDHEKEIETWTNTLSEEFGKNPCLKPFRFRRGTGRAYFIIAHPDHEASLNRWVPDAQAKLNPLLQTLRETKSKKKREKQL